MDRLPAAFARELAPVIQLARTVEKVSQDERGVTVAYVDDQGRRGTVSADYCICTIPLSVLRSVDLQVSPEFKAAIGEVAYAPVGKIGLQMERRFWEEDHAIYGGYIYLDDPEIGSITMPSTGWLGQKGVEVLTDGAAAQYRSDAIAGVVNVILKTANHGGSITATGGEYYEGDGPTAAWSINKGFNLNDRGFFNITVEEPSGRRRSPLVEPRRHPAVVLVGHQPQQGSGQPARLSQHQRRHRLQHLRRFLQRRLRSRRRGAALQLRQLRPADRLGVRELPRAQQSRGLDLDGSARRAVPHRLRPSEKFAETDYSFTGGVKGTTSG